MTLNILIMLIMPLTYTALSKLAEDHYTSPVCSDHMGCVRGRLMRGYNIPLFEAFMGIPYALPPVGELRFSVSKMGREGENLGHY